MADKPGKSAKSVQGTRTEKNLMAAFAGESMARNRYTYFAKQAKKDGYVQISDIFTETAEQERIHAKRFFSFLEGGAVEAAYPFPAGPMGSTYDNLMAAAEGEKHEHSSMYPEFAAIAKEEGFPAVTAAFNNISVAERFHERRYRALAENIAAGRVFERDAPTLWRCRHCGYTHEGPKAYSACPACLHPQAYFEVAPLNW